MTQTEAGEVFTVRLTGQDLVNVHIALLCYGNSLRGKDYTFFSREIYAVADEVERQQPQLFAHLEGVR